MAGDVNCDLLVKNPKGDALLSFCASVNATQLIDKPTRVTKSLRSLLDVLIVSNVNQVKTKGVLEVTISDHYLVHATLDLKRPTLAPRFISMRSFKCYKADQFSSDMEHIPWDTINLMESDDEKLDAFNDLFLAGLDSHAPVKMVNLRRKPNPAITPEIKELITKRNQLHVKAWTTGSGMDWDAFGRLRREIKLSVRQVERDYFNEQVTINKGNSGCIWKTIRRALPNTSTQCHQYTKATSTLANEFNRFFVSVGENAANKSEQLAKSYGLDTRSSLISTNVTYAEAEQFEFQPVSCADVRKVIMAMPSNKAPYMNDLPDVIKSSNIKSYVDDTKRYLSFSTNDVDSCLRLVEDDLGRVAEWCCANHLLVNPDKTNLLLFGTRKLLSQLHDVTVPFLGQELKLVDSV